MKTPQSLRSRLIVAATAWIALGMVLSWFMLSSVFRSHVSEQFNDELFVHLEELRRLAHVEGGRANMSANLSDPRYDIANSGFYWEIQQGGEVLARSSSMKAAPLKTPPDGRLDVGVHMHRVDGPTGELIVAEVLEWKDPSKAPVQFIIGTDKQHLENVVADFNYVLSWALTALGLSMVVAASLLILFAMKPLSQLNTALHEVRAGKSGRLTGSYPTEVQPLVDNLNAMFASTTELIQRARTQAGNIAHGLKTPLAILTDEAYRLQSRGQPDTAQTILDQCRKMETHIDYQTTRARVVANRLSPGASANVGDVASDVVSAISRIYAHKALRFDVDVPTSLRVGCEVQDLQEVLANLLDNGSKHADSKVVLTALETEAGSVEISVEDDGEGLPPEAHEIVFKVGERWDTQSSGSGLGLAITRDLVTLYGGTISLAESSLGGLRATIQLPQAG